MTTDSPGTPNGQADEDAVSDGGVDPPYGIIARELRGGHVVPFLGAGSSRIAMPESSPVPPSGLELASMLAGEASFPSSDALERGDLAKVSSYYVDGSNRAALQRKLRDVFLKQRFVPNSLHTLLASVPNDEMVVVTTNYDTLLEQAFTAAGKHFEVVVYDGGNGVLWWRHGEPEPRRIKANEIDPADIGRTNLIYKVHGTVKAEAPTWDRFVITEEDYIRFLSQMSTAVPPAFSEYFRERAFLFLGYGLRDWNMRVMLKQVSSPDVTSWAIQYKPSRLERKLWERRKVDIFDVSLEEFVRNMQAAGAALP